MGSLRQPLGLQQAVPLSRPLGTWPSHNLLTAAMVALVEYGIVACKIVDELVLPNKKGALCGDGIVDGGGEVTLGAVEGAYPATVNAQLQRSTASGEQGAFASAPTSCSDNCFR